MGTGCQSWEVCLWELALENFLEVKFQGSLKNWWILCLWDTINVGILSEILDVLFTNQLKGRGCSVKICSEAYQTHGFSPVVYLSTQLFSIESFEGKPGELCQVLVAWTQDLCCSAPKIFLLHRNLIPLNRGSNEPPALRAPSLNPWTTRSLRGLFKI